MVSSKVIIRLFLGILIIGLFFRIYNLDTESLWTDEAFSARIASSEGIQEVIIGVAQTEAAPPGYYVLLHYWVHVFGDSMFMLRLLSVLFSILAIVMLFLLVRMLFNTNVALLASLFMATSMLQIEYAQEARIYTLFTFLSLTSAYFFVKWWKNGKATLLWWHELFTLLALYVNYIMIFIISGYLLFLFSQRKEFPLHWKKWLRVHSLFFSLCIPLLPLILAQFTTLNTGLAETLISKGMPAILAQLGLFLFALPALGFTLILAFVVSAPKVKQLLAKMDHYFFPLMVLIGCAYLYVSVKPFVLHGIPFIRVPITNSYFLIRHSFFLVPLWYVYLGYKVNQYFSHRKKYYAAAIIAIVLFFSFFSLHQYYTQPTKAQWQEAIEFIDENSSSGKVLVLLDKGGQSNEFLFQYYAPQDWLLLRLTWAGEWRDFQQVDEDRLFGLLEKTDGFWLVLSRNARTGYYYRDLLDEKYERHRSKVLYGVEVYYYYTQKVNS